MIYRPGVIALALLFISVARAGCESWPDWQQFTSTYISRDGRVIDPADGKNITTSEGQSYALFFALVANDRPMFTRLLKWTENNLAAGNLAQRLPAWLWGQNSTSKKWQVLDSNSASDADTWIAWTLLEAGRLWHSRDYQVAGTRLLNRIAKEEIATLPGFGLMLLPGKQGFTGDNVTIINPSYLPLPLLTALSKKHARWAEVNRNALRLLLETAPKGFSPDWYSWRAGHDWQPVKEKGTVGGYDAIRVYLWAGIMNSSDTRKASLLKHFAPMANITARDGAPPERINILNGTITHQGNAGFSAALLPFLHRSPALQAQRKRVQQQGFTRDAYYRTVLTLFGQGWDEGRYRLSAAGHLLPVWGRQCATSD